MPSLHGKVAIVTGANIGLGKEMAKQLAAGGAKVYVACRSEERALKAVAEVMKEIEVERETRRKASGKEISVVGIEFLKLDLCDLKGCVGSAKEFMAKEDRLDILSECVSDFDKFISESY